MITDEISKFFEILRASREDVQLERCRHRGMEFSISVCVGRYEQGDEVSACSALLACSLVTGNNSVYPALLVSAQ
jgi:hypothetical protein